MIHNLPAIRVTIQQKVRKKKRTVLILIFSTISQKHEPKITCTSQYFVCEHGKVFFLTRTF